MARPVLKIGLSLAALAVVAAGVYTWQMLRVEEIPEELEAIEPAAQAAAKPYSVPGDGGLPDFRLEDHAGKTLFIVVEGMASMKSGEGRLLGRALNRWEFPDTTAGFMIGDAEGFGMFKSKAQEFMGAMRAEFRYPLYVDFDGATTQRFKLPKGHSGLVVVDPQGEVKLRKSGALDDAALEEVRAALGATEPQPGDTVPDFSIGPLSAESCRGSTCVLAFLGEGLRREDVPGVEGGFDKKGDEARKHLNRPEVRLASALAKMPPKDGFRGVVVGQIEDYELEGWATVEPTPGLGQPFGLADGETAILIVDPQGRSLYDARGTIRMYQWDRIAELMGVDMQRSFARGPGKADKDGAPG